MKQYFYKSNMMEKNYLASYADAYCTDNALFFINTLTDRQLILTGENALLQKLLLALENGVSDVDLDYLLSQCNAGHVLESLLREGMIE